jgi:aspartate carbamoyltransferase catalytic subunit
MQHLLSVDDLGGRAGIEAMLDLTDSFLEVTRRDIPKVPALRGKTVVSLFYEDSTRTRLSFETASRRLSADTMNFSVSTSSVKKGESLLDTVQTIDAMGVDAIIVRHSAAGAPHRVATWSSAHVINAGDGCHEHPTQALLDAFTLRRHRGPSLDGCRIAIVGDIRHSRVARSAFHAFRAFGVPDLRIVAPPAFMPEAHEFAGATRFGTLKSGLKDVDVVMMLRIQKERMTHASLPDGDRYFAKFGLTPERLALARPDAIVMHPQPMNRGIEIASDVADGAQSAIRDQVRNGVAVRMAVLAAVVPSPGARA